MTPIAVASSADIDNVDEEDDRPTAIASTDDLDDVDGVGPAKDPTPQRGPDEYDGMGRLKLVSILRARGVDYAPAGKDIEALKALARASE